MVTIHTYVCKLVVCFTCNFGMLQDPFFETLFTAVEFEPGKNTGIPMLGTRLVCGLPGAVCMHITIWIIVYCFDGSTK